MGQVNERLAGRSPEEILCWASGRFAHRLAFATGFGPEGLGASRPHRPPSPSRRRLHPRHRPLLPRDLRALAAARGALRLHHSSRAPRAFRGGAGRAPRRCALGPRARSLLLPPQGRAPRRRPRAPRGVDQRHSRRPDPGPRGGARGGARSPPRPREGQPPPRLVERRRVGLPPRPRRAHEPPPRAGLPQHRMLALHEPRRLRAKTPAPAAGAATSRPNAGSTRARPHPVSRLTHDVSKGA